MISLVKTKSFKIKILMIGTATLCIQTSAESFNIPLLNKIFKHWVKILLISKRTIQIVRTMMMRERTRELKQTWATLTIHFLRLLSDSKDPQRTRNSYFYPKRCCKRSSRSLKPLELTLQIESSKYISNEVWNWTSKMFKEEFMMLWMFCAPWML